MYSPLISWARYVYLAGIAVALLLLVPSAWFPFQLGKIAAFATLLVVCVLFLVLGRGVREALRARGFFLALLAGLLPVFYLVSLALSTHRSIALLGYSIETDTALFSLLVFLVFVISFILFRTLRSVNLLLRVVFWALIVAVVFQAVVILFGPSLLQLFADRSTNLIGKWNDFGLVVGFLAILLLIRVELGRIAPLYKAGIGVCLVALTILLGLINFGVVWGMLLAFCIVLAVVAFFVQKTTAQESMESRLSGLNRVPWFAISGAVISLVFVLFGSGINTTLTKILPVSSLEVRPSYNSTLDVITAARGNEVGRIFIGTGPNTFGQSWLMHKPAEVNQSYFWNLDFNVGFSTLMTALGSVGLFGVLAWLIPLLLVLSALVRAIRLGALSPQERVVATSIGLGTLFLMFAIILYVPSQNLILLTFTLAGAAFGFLWRQGRAATPPHEEMQTSRLGVLGVALVSILLLGVTVWSGFAIDRRLVAQSLTNMAAAALQTGDTDKALAYAAHAQKVEVLPDTLRFVIDANNIKLQKVAQDTTLAQTDAQQLFTKLASDAVQAGQTLLAIDAADYRSHLVLARFYDFLTNLKIEGAYEGAKKSYEDALALNPSNPAILLAISRLEGAAGNATASEEVLSRALTLKPNYTDAILFSVQLSVAKNDLPNAIRAATNAVQTAPGVAPIWFQLGLLFYATGDTTNAALALQQAVTIVPDYANAKYFLGLSYYAQKKTVEAITQFEDLQKTNPDNAEVKLILSNMASGKDPFASSTPPFTPPEARPQAPIAQ